MGDHVQVGELDEPGRGPGPRGAPERPCPAAEQEQERQRAAEGRLLLSGRVRRHRVHGVAAQDLPQRLRRHRHLHREHEHE